MQRLLQTAICFACTLSAYWLYAALVVPWIEPAAGGPGNGNGDGGAAYQAVQQVDLSRIFPAGSWELDQAKVLETDGGVLVFKDWERDADNQMRIQPVTLILFTDNDDPSPGEIEAAAEEEENPDQDEADREPGEQEPVDEGPVRPIILRAPEGAVLTMEGDTNPNQAEFGKPTGGRLIGDVMITREGTPARDDALRIVTRNVQIEPERVWTPQEVAFQYGRSHGRGRDLEIALTTSDSRGREDALGSVHSLKLMHIDHLVIDRPSQDQDTAGQDNSGQDAGAPGSASRSTPFSDVDAMDAWEGPIRITAAGPFRFDFERYQASFENQVRMLRSVPGHDPDTLLCDRFQIEFRSPDDGESDDEESDDGTSDDGGTGSDTPLSESPASGESLSEILRVVAAGNVSFDSPSMRTAARGDRFEYDVASGRFTLRGAEPVLLQHQKVEIEAGHLEYRLNEQGPRRLGELWASGPGRFQTAVGTGKPRQFVARWHDMLRLQPQAPNHVISLYGRAFVAFQDVGQFAADDLHLYVWEEELPGPTADADSKPEYRVVPDRMLARGGVRFDSPQMVGQTDEVNVWFRQLGEGSGASANSSSGENDSRDPGVRPPTGSLNGREPLERAAARANDPRRIPADRVRVEGELVQLQVLLDAESRATIEDLTIRGGVTVRQPADPAMPARLVLQGEMIQMSDVGTTLARGRVVGQPARVVAEGNDIQTGEIQVFQDANEIRVDMPGSMVLPLVSRIGVATGTPQGRVAVRWKGGLRFDGRQARFTGGIEISGNSLLDGGETSEFSGKSREMVVTMNKRIDFQKPPKSFEKLGGTTDARTIGPAAVPGKPPEVAVARLELVQDVILQNRTFQSTSPTARRQLSYDELRAPRIIYNHGLRQIDAAGPGQAVTVRRDSSLKQQVATAGPPGTGPVRTGARRNGTGAGEEDENKLVFIEVQFENGLTGNLLDRQVQFFDSVRTIYGPVQSWTERVDFTRREGLSDRDVELQCQRMQITEMQLQNQSWIEFEAAGNTRVEGRRFSARSQRITYNQGKDLLILHGDGRNPATLEMQQRAGEQPKRLQAGKIHYSPGTRNVELQDLRTFDLGPAASNGLRN